MSEVAGNAKRAVDDHADRGVDSTGWSFVLRAHLHLCFVRHITSRLQGPLSCLWITPHDGCALLDSLYGLCESFASTIIIPGSFWSFLNYFILLAIVIGIQCVLDHLRPPRFVPHPAVLIDAFRVSRTLSICRGSHGRPNP